MHDANRRPAHGTARPRTFLVLVVQLAVTLPSLAFAQGAGSTGGQVLQLVAGARAAGFSGAYTAAHGDADALFYNPAGIAALMRGAALSYESYVEDIGLASFGGAYTAGRFSFGLGGLYLDAGAIPECAADPDFGGNRCMVTGRTVSASEAVARISLARPFGESLRLGLSAGLLSVSLAEEARSTPVIDLGAQYDLSSVTLGAALRNVGGSLSSDSLADAELPTEARLGAAFHFVRPNGIAVNLHTDLVARVREGSAGILVGAEAGWLPGAPRAVGAMARIGYDAADGSGGLGSLKLGAGLTLDELAIDYAYQHYEALGAVHRFGLRWTVSR
jgi:hypothetical protein